MKTAADLSQAHCIILLVHFTSEGNIRALRSLTALRRGALEPELVFRVLLTYLPEAIEPKEYTTYLKELASSLDGDQGDEAVEVDVSPVDTLDEAHAQKKIRKLDLLELSPPHYPPHAPDDLLTRFLCHRGHRIDQETGLLNLVPELFEPFLARNEYIRTWCISNVLPLVRLGFEYYPDDPSLVLSLSEFELLQGKKGVDYLLHETSRSTRQGYTGYAVTRDMKGLVGPWMYGNTERKRRRLEYDEQGTIGERSPTGGSDEPDSEMRYRNDHDWDYVYRWMVQSSVENFPLITNIIDGWDGPEDVDLGGYDPGRNNKYLHEDMRLLLKTRYAQAAFASCYAVQSDTEESAYRARSVSKRISTLLDYPSPPELTANVDMLPKAEAGASLLHATHTKDILQPERLLTPEHPLTSPTLAAYDLLQIFVHSAFLLTGLGRPASPVRVAEMKIFRSPGELMSVLQAILRNLSQSLSPKNESQWSCERDKLVWLWDWGLNPQPSAVEGAGVFGKIPREEFEGDILTSLVGAKCHGLVIKLYLTGPQSLLHPTKVEQLLLSQAWEAYDGASNGNRTRGGVKKANDIITAFRPYFERSVGFQEATALISATHALSFYSLTLQHGVPFQPVSIRVSHDPVGLISKVLEQNPGSYTQLDDLIDIGRNLVASGLGQGNSHGAVLDEEGENDDANEMTTNVEQRVTFMAIEASLREDDFETAYSYIVNRLTPDADIEKPGGNATRSGEKARGGAKGSITSVTVSRSIDDASWRAAFLAGRYRPSSSTATTLRRLEQRTELLSLALLLAPVSALADILAAWRRCEEEMTTLQVSQREAEEAFDTMADKRANMSNLPGHFAALDEQPQRVLGQKRREIGRMSGRGGAEAPVSMFDLTRSATQAFSQKVFPLRNVVSRSSSWTGSGIGDGLDSAEDRDVEQDRPRKRDMVANAVSGGLASGLGWMLGATPVDQQGNREVQ